MCKWALEPEDSPGDCALFPEVGDYTVITITYGLVWFHKYEKKTHPC